MYQYHRITLFHVFWLAAVAGFTAGGLMLGQRLFSVIGAILGGIIGFIVGNILGSIPEWLSDKIFFRQLERSSNSELKSMIASDPWKFCHTMALLQLGARGEDVQTELPRIITMLESDSQLTRMYGWDALRIVFSKETQVISDFNPKESTEQCRSKVVRLKQSAELTSTPTATTDCTVPSESAPSEDR